MSESKYFFLNGCKYVINAKLTVLDILVYFNYNRSLLVLEYNRLICDRKNWGKIYIENNDVLEIITIVGGG